MAQTILIRRGTKAQLDAITLSNGELGYTTDTDEVYIGDGSAHHLVGRVLVGLLSARPTAGVSGRIYLATDNGLVYVDNGSAWVQVTADLIDDGSIVTDKTWSSSKIDSEITAAIAGLDWQSDINDYVADAATTAPGVGLPAAATGQRYILASNTGSLHANWGTITGVGDNDIVEYDGANWNVVYDVSVQGEGAIAWNMDDNYFMYWDGAIWGEFGGLSGVTAGHGLYKDGNTIHSDLTDVAGTGLEATGTPGTDETLRIATGAAGNGLTGGGGSALAVQAETGKGIAVGVSGVSVALDATLRTAAGANDVANNPIYADSGGLNIKIDDTSLKLDGTNGNRIYVDTVDGGTFA